MVLPTAVDSIIEALEALNEARGLFAVHLSTLATEKSLDFLETSSFEPLDESSSPTEMRIVQEVESFQPI